MSSEESFPRLPKDAPVMFHSVDRDGRLADVSNHWLTVLGYQRSEVIGRRSTDFLTEESRRYAQEVVLPAFFKTGFCNDIAYQLVTKGGKVLDILLSATAEMNEAGELVRSLAVLTDVTDRKRAERALLLAEAVFSKTFRSYATVLAISALSDERLIEVNESFERILGYRRAETLGKEMHRLPVWENPADYGCYLQTLEESGEVRDLEVRFRSNSGKIVVGLVSGDVIELYGERYLLTQINDITERKKVAQEIEVLHTALAARAYELEVANEQLEAFSYTVSHDLRKPLTAISGYCQVILDTCKGQLEPRCEDYIQEILSGTDRMNELVDTLLEYSRLGHYKPYRQAMDLSLPAKEIALELEMMEPQRRVEFEIAPEMTDHADPKLLRIVLENLLGNAWKYSAHNQGARIQFGRFERDGKNVYYVRDNGVGFEGADADGLFTAFRRLPGTEEFDGYGIGLATVDRIIKSHGGKIWAEGEPGKGAVFYFTVN